jgi:hypothetical protein
MVFNASRYANISEENKEISLKYQKSKKSMHAGPCHQKPEFSLSCMETYNKTT